MVWHALRAYLIELQSQSVVVDDERPCYIPIEKGRLDITTTVSTSSEGREVTIVTIFIEQ